MAEHVMRAPVMDPALSLGWRDGPLDGLSCVLRCVESALRAEGFTQMEIAEALARPVDLVGSRRDSSCFRYGRLKWRNVRNGRDNWEELAELVGDGTPCVLMPDRYYWPGDEFERRHHFFDHMVLAVGLRNGYLEVLDTDAPAQDGYRRRLAVVPSLIKGICRFATVHFSMPCDDMHSHRESLLVPMAVWLAEDLPSMACFAARWQHDGLSGPLARSLHVMVLGELQPMLFLSGLAVGKAYPAAAVSLTRASRRAQILGKTLIGAHRYGGADPRNVHVYEPVLPLFKSLQSELIRLCCELHEELGLAQPNIAAGDGDDRLWIRVLQDQRWCFSDEVNVR